MQQVTRTMLKNVKQGQIFRFFSDSPTAYVRGPYNRKIRKYPCHMLEPDGITINHCGFVPVYVFTA